MACAILIQHFGRTMRKHVATLVPYDFKTNNIFLVRATNWFPRPEGRNKIKFIGGHVEDGENAFECILRETKEEFPGFYGIIDWTSIRCIKSEPVGDEWFVTSYIAPASLSQEDFLSARQEATESTPEFYDMDAYIHPNNFMAYCYEAYVLAMKNIRHLKGL